MKLKDQEEALMCDSRDNDVHFLNHALLAKIIEDPQKFREVINSPEGDDWKLAIKSELNLLADKTVFQVVEKNNVKINEQIPNIIDSRCIFKRIDESGNIKFKARLVARSYKDKNNYDFSDIYDPISRLLLIRAFIAIGTLKIRLRHVHRNTRKCN